MEHVAYIIKNKNNQFRGYIAILNPDGDDAALFVTNTTDKSEKLEDIQQKMKELPADIKTYMNPIEPNQTGISWLSELKAANP